MTHNLLDLLQNHLEIKFINSFIRVLIFNLLFNFSVIYHIILYIIYQFKILTMTYKALKGMAPSYICDLLQVHHLNRNLRSASRGLSLVVPAYHTQAYGARSFSLAAPTLRNSLPVDIKNTQSLSNFKKRLKRFIFN